jgi:hypothetical protein
MNTKYLFAILLISVLVLGCTSQETKTTDSSKQTPAPAVVEKEPIQPQTPAIKPVVAVDTMLIADTENQRVIEINKNTNEITWQYGCDQIYPSTSRCFSGTKDNQLYQPTSAVYDGSLILIADKANNRVIKVDRDKTVKWNFSDVREPTYVALSSDKDVLITDSVNNRVLKVDDEANVVWEYGCARRTAADKCAPGKGDNELNVPNSAVELKNGNVLIADKGNNRIIEVSEDKHVIMEYKIGLSFPSSAIEAGNNYVIANTNGNKVVVISQSKEIVKEFSGYNHPTYAAATDKGYLIVDSYNNKVIEIDNDGNIIWHYGDCAEFEGVLDKECNYGVNDSQLFKPSAASG